MYVLADQIGIENVPELDTGDCPFELIHLLDWFYQLDSARSWTEGGPCPISFTDIMNWRLLLNLQVDPWEVKALKEIDQVYLNAFSEKMQKKVRKNA